MWKSHLGDWKSKFTIQVLWGRAVASVKGPSEICSPKIKVRTRHTDNGFSQAVFCCLGTSSKQADG